MYSTSIKNGHYLIKCIALFEQVRIIKFIVDMGAKFTCCNYKFFDRNIDEKYLMGNETKFLSGFVKGSPVKFYKCSLDQFTIGNIDIGKQDIWLTFDMWVTDMVLGTDILQQVIFTANPYNKRVYFCKDSDDYNGNFKLVTA